MSAGEVALRGEMGSVRAASRSVSRLDGLQQAMSSLGQGIRHVQAAGDARSLTQLAAVCRPLETRAQRIASVRTEVGRALSTYADQVDRMQQDARRLRTSLAEAQAQQAAQQTQLAGLDAADPEFAGSSQRLGARIDELGGVARSIERQLADLDLARQAANRRCTAQVNAGTAALNTLARAGGSAATASTVSLAGFTRPNSANSKNNPGAGKASWWEQLLALGAITGLVMWESQKQSAEEILAHLQDAAGFLGNVVASLGNALISHPDLLLELLGGIGLIVLGAGEEIGGVALDATGVGALGGVPLNIAGVASIASGLALIGAAGPGVVMHALTDSAQRPFDTNHVGRLNSERNAPNPNHAGRNKAGEYTKEGNDAARADSQLKEAQGLQKYEKEFGLEPDPTQVAARVDGVKQPRFYDGLAKKPDGTYEGVEVKSATASKSPNQREFDNSVSYENPAYATLNGVRIKITSVVEIKVK